MAPSRAPMRHFQEYSESESDSLSGTEERIPTLAQEGIDDEEASEEDHSSEDGVEDPDSDEAVKQRLSKVSFASLAKAQDELLGEGGGRKRKRRGEINEEAESKLEVLRARLRELRERKREAGVVEESEVKTKKSRKDKPRNEVEQDTGRSGFFGDDSASDSGSYSDAPSDASASKEHRKRSSKHAPTAMPANRAVPRHRNVVPIATIKARDPRFDPLAGGKLDQNILDNRYAFLNDYQASELSSLRKALKDRNTKLTLDERDIIKRKIVSLESKIASNKARERQSKVVREHRKKEKELVAEGKKPFYLKQSEVKKQALTERFESLKGRQKDKVVKRRIKKLASRERRNMPTDRRV